MTSTPLQPAMPAGYFPQRLATQIGKNAGTPYQCQAAALAAARKWSTVFRARKIARHPAATTHRQVSQTLIYRRRFPQAEHESHQVLWQMTPHHWHESHRMIW